MDSAIFRAKDVTQEDVIEYYFRDHSRRAHCLLLGAGGTGKSYTTKAILRHIYKETGVAPLVLAPTHKALRNFKDTPCMQATVHKFLMSRPFRNPDTGELSFTRPDDDQVSIIQGQAPTFACVDEAGMVSRYQWEKLVTIFPSLLTVGDPNQLPPVKETHSAAFDHGDVVWRLSVDYRSPGPLSSLKNTYLTDDPSPLPETLSEAQAIRRILDNPDSAFLANSNARVSAFNKMVRLKKHGKGASEIMVGDKILATRTTKSCDICSNDVFEVVYASEQVIRFSGVVRSMGVVVKDYDEDITTYLCELLDDGGNILTAMIVGAESADWLEHEDLSEAFWRRNPEAITYLYAWGYTTYRAQGSTIQDVVVDLNDISKVRATRLRQQLTYVAVSRAGRSIAAVA
jgi:hypothetical protein